MQRSLSRQSELELELELGLGSVVTTLVATVVTTLAATLIGVHRLPTRGGTCTPTTTTTATTITTTTNRITEARATTDVVQTIIMGIVGEQQLYSSYSFLIN